MGGSRERRCIVTGEVLPEARLLRFALSPDGQVVASCGQAPFRPGGQSAGFRR